MGWVTVEIIGQNLSRHGLGTVFFELRDSVMRASGHNRWEALRAN